MLVHVRLVVIMGLLFTSCDLMDTYLVIVRIYTTHFGTTTSSRYSLFCGILSWLYQHRSKLVLRYQILVVVSTFFLISTPSRFITTTYQKAYLEFTARRSFLSELPSLAVYGPLTVNVGPLLHCPRAGPGPVGPRVDPTRP